MKKVDFIIPYFIIYGNAKRGGVSPRLKIWPGDLDLWPWKLIGFQILLRTKYVPSLVKIYWRMLILECSQGCYRRTDGRIEGRTEGSVTISLRNFVGEGIITNPSYTGVTSNITGFVIADQSILKWCQKWYQVLLKVIYL